MSKMLHASLSDRYHEVLKEAADNAGVTKSELIRDWIRDLPEFKSTKPRKPESDFNDK